MLVEPWGFLFRSPHHNWHPLLCPPSLDSKQRKGRKGQLGAEGTRCRPL